MPYSVGEKGSYGCSGYPAIKTKTGEVMGCHETQADAEAQIAAIHASEGAAADKADEASIMTSSTEENPSNYLNPEAGMKHPQVCTPDSKDCGDKMCKVCSMKKSECCPEEVIDKSCWEGYTQRGMKPGKNGSMVPNCVPISKADRQIVEGDYVMGQTSEGFVVGQVEHIMTEGGVYGTPGTEYAIQSTPENPAMAVRMFEQEEDGKFCPTAYSIGMLYNNATIVDIEIAQEDSEGSDEMEKAEGYSPPAGARAAARRAIKFKEDGKANGAGTAVGWTRAGQLARGETLSLSTVKRMYSYFSRHEVDKKGKDWANQSNPSNGYIMWLAWGGDAGFSWSRGIVNRMKDKAMFADFGKDYTRSSKNIYRINE